MDETPLVDSLRQKLDELEREVEACRRHLLAEFHHHCRLLLRDVAPDAASEVKRVLAASFDSYPTLRPELDADSPRPSRPRHPPPSSPSPPHPISAAAFQSTSGSPPRARQRDLELRGLFTPSYLPLLDDDSSPVSPRLDRDHAIGTAPDPPLPPDGGSGHAAMDQTGHYGAASQHRLLPPVPPLSVPDPANDTARSTDDARSSISSDKSDSKPPRSALRRSSSMSKAPQSPRRVRFEFMGAEVLPTTRPQPSGGLRRRPSSPGPDPDDPTVFASNLGADTTEDDRVPPRKVSSSDALRALSRTPREEGVAWTIVNADVDQATPHRQHALPASPPTAASTPPKTSPGPTIPVKTFAHKQSSAETPAADEHDEDEDEDDDDGSSSDDGFLAMPKARSFAKTPSQVPASAPEAPIKPPLGGATRPASPMSRQLPRPDSAEGEHRYDDSSEVDDDDVFHFEAGGPPAPARSRWSPRPASREQDKPEPSGADDDEPNAPETQTPEQQTSSFATSPAVPIRQSWGTRPGTTSGVKFRPGSVGSYKGQPLMMPIVRDPELLAQAGSLGSSELRVGGVDDQTAMEDGSPPRFPSTPFSFKERFMMEEMMERSKSNEDERGR